MLLMWRSILPEFLEPPRSQLRIAYRVLNVLVAEVHLDRARILAGIRQIEARRVPEHMRMNRELDAGRLCGFHHNVMDGASCHRTATQRREHIRRGIVLFALPGPQGPK